MMLLDTNVVSELRKADRCDARVAKWQASQAVNEQYVSVITLLELKLGIELEKSRNPAFAENLNSWYETRVKPAFHGRIHLIDAAVAESCARLHAQRTRSYRDGLIAATARVHGLTVVTRNVADFQGAGVSVINPWD